MRILMSAKDEKHSVLRAAKRHASISWQVPKDSRPGDQALVFLPEDGFSARCMIETTPRRNKNGHYVARVGNIELLPAPVPLSYLRKQVAEWGWPKKPLHYTSIDEAIANRVEKALRNYPGNIARSISKKRFTVAQIMDALESVEPILTPYQLMMLEAHYQYRKLSMGRLAEYGGYDNYGAANLQYGKMCSRIAKELGFRSRSKTFTIASVCGKDSDGHFQWELDDVVVKALKSLRWFAPAAEECIVKDNPAGQKCTESASQYRMTEKMAEVKQRVHADLFRKRVKDLWRSCSVTGCEIESVMNASHIVPWKDGKSKQRLDQYNGLWLIPNLDRLFDRHLISFQEDGSLLVSRKLPEKEWAKLGINKGQKLRFVKPEMLPYLKKHRATLRKGEKSRS
jgi:hypothetical protein